MNVITVAVNLLFNIRKIIYGKQSSPGKAVSGVFLDAACDEPLPITKKSGQIMEGLIITCS